MSRNRHVVFLETNGCRIATIAGSTVRWTDCSLDAGAIASALRAISYRGEPILLEAQGPLGPRPPRAATAPQSTAVIPRTGGDQTAALALGAAAVIGLAAKRAKEISD